METVKQRITDIKNLLILKLNILYAKIETRALKTTKVIAGTGLTGGGDLSTDKTINVDFGTTAGTVAQGNDSRINNGKTAFEWGNHALTEVGGRNLMRNSGNFKDTYFWDSYSGITSITLVDGKIRCIASNTGIPRIRPLCLIPLSDIPEQYIISIEYIPTNFTFITAIGGKSSSSLTRFNEAGAQQAGSTVNIKNIDFGDRKKSIFLVDSLIKGPSLLSSWFVFYIPTNSTVDIINLKIEKGNKATDWTPAPEDQITDWNATSGFSQLLNKPTVISVETDPIYTASVIKQVMIKSYFSNGEDLNTYEYTGVYGCNTNVVATSLLNCPSTSAFELTVKRVSDSMIFQELTNHLTNDKWIRNRYTSTSWSTWRLFWSSLNFNPASKEDIFSKNNAFNKNFGDSIGTVAQGNHTHPDIYTMSQVDSMLSSTYRVKGSVATFANLPATLQKEGDVWNILNTGENYVWVLNLNNTGVAGWDKLSGVVDLSAYATVAWVNSQLALKADTSNVYTKAQALEIFVGINGVQSISDTKIFIDSPIVPNPTLGGHAVNRGFADAQYVISKTVDWTDIPHNLPANFINVVLRYKTKNGNYTLDFSWENDGSGSGLNNSEFEIAVLPSIDSSLLTTIDLKAFTDNELIRSFGRVTLKSTGNDGENVSLVSSTTNFGANAESAVTRITMPIAK